MGKKASRTRVRLKEKSSERSSEYGRKGGLKKPPRDENGRAINKYKAVLEGYRENGLEPKVLAGHGITRVPMFVAQPALANRIVKLIRKGYPYTTVCRYVGVTPKTFKDWLEKGRNGYTPEYVSFYERVARAEATAEMRVLNTLKKHERADWRVSAWQLERRWPEHWAKKDRIIAETHVSGNLVVDSKEALGKAVTHDEAARELARKLISGDDFSYTRLPAPEEETQLEDAK